MLENRGDPEGLNDQTEALPKKQPVDRATRERFEVEALKHLDTVYRVAVMLCRSSDEAEDLVQETFIRAFQAFKGFELRSYGAKPWLLRILHNTFYSYKNKQRRSPATIDDLDFDQFSGKSDDGALPLTTESFDWDTVEDEIKTAMFDLQPEYRMVLMLWAVEGLSYKEIAEVCNCALGTVMSRLYRARKQLSQQLHHFANDRKWSNERKE